MKHPRLLTALVALSSVLYLPVACSSSDSQIGAASGGEGGAATGDGDGDSGATTGEGDGDGDISLGGNPNTCSPSGNSCEAGSDCCSGQCNPETNTCARVLGQCSQTSAACETGAECCSLSCVDKRCSVSACIQDTQSCTEDGECCGGNCTDGSCAVINAGSGATCKTSGNSCNDSVDCCSGLCGDDGLCNIASSYCIQTSDVCNTDNNCCQGVCIKESSASTGYCGMQESPGTRCSGKKVAGEVCGGDCSACCSRTCAPDGISGVMVCQRPTGCHTDGELCRSVNDCCGGNPNSTVPGAGTAQCVRVNEDDEVGRCKVGACNPDGAICGSPDDGTAACDGSLSAPNGQKCCGTKQADWDKELNACVTDSLRVPRCSTILGDCVEEGDDCATADDCCSDMPCVQNEEGRFICYEPEDGKCVSSGGPCTANADCCVGSLCISEPGAATGVCGNVAPPKRPGGAGGSSSGDGGSASGDGGSSSGDGGSASGDGGSSIACAAYGQDCYESSDCCGDVPCDASSKTCLYPIR